MTKILVTGGAGFIGSHLVHAFVSRGTDVAVIDDLSSGRRDSVPAGVPLHEVDIRDASGVGRAFDAFRPTHVLHLAGQVSVGRSVRDPQGDSDVNVRGGLAVLAAAAARKARHFLFASSGGAYYGDVPDGQRAPESWPARPKSPYGASKAAFESYLRTFTPADGMKRVSLRLGNVYGPRQRPDEEAGVVAVFIERLLKGEPVSVVARSTSGDPGCVRDYVFVEDVVQAFLIAVDATLEGAYNVGTGRGRSTREMLDAVAAAIGASPRVHPAAARPGEVGASVLDSSSLSALGWRPSVPFDEGVRRTVDWFRQRSAARS